MQILTIDPTLIAQGRAVFEASKKCGPVMGLPVVPGAIVAAIEDGIFTEEDIERNVSRYTRCRRSTVKTVLENLSTKVNPNGLWSRDQDGRFRLVDQPVQPFTVMAI